MQLHGSTELVPGPREAEHDPRGPGALLEQGYDHEHLQGAGTLPWAAGSGSSEVEPCVSELR